MSPVEEMQTPGASIRPTVLVVEDVVLVHLLLADVLRGRGFEVVEAPNADEAVRALESDRAVDVVLADIHMPGSSMDGLGLAHWVHDHRPDLKVVLASGVVAEVDASEADYHEGPILKKPVDHAELERRLRMAVQH